ncbi:MAG TPA: HNH endonuclease signature motif containing protein, partial [Verrucomicrobiae bacterium]|nr:HNH endonuclease signature motif containing protein [Verrucomicrobiae bacterium]
DLAAAVRARAANRCQYCLMHQSLQGATFHVEHIIPRAKGGATELSNLALACPGWNLPKADRTMAIDPDSGVAVSLFHPIRQVWSEHFRFSGDRIEGLSPTGRATVVALDLNHSRRRRIRAAETRLGLRRPDSRL